MAVLALVVTTVVILALSYGVSARALDTIVVLVHPPGLVAAAVRAVDSIVECTVGTLDDTVLLDHVCVKGLAFAVAGAVASVALVVGVLRLGVGPADVDVEGAREDFMPMQCLASLTAPLGHWVG